MNENEVNLLIKDLKWNVTEEIKQKTISKLELVEDEKLYMLLQPEGKAYWDNAALAIRKIGYPRIKIIIPGLMEWLQDINWPGTSIVIEILESIPQAELLPYIEKSLVKASNEEDFMWIGSIKRLVEVMNIHQEKFSSKDIYKLLNLSDWY